MPPATKPHHRRFGSRLLHLLQALRRLVADGRDLNAIRRTVCWDYLNRLHTSLPQDYRSPDELIQRYQRGASPAQAD